MMPLPELQIFNEPFNPVSVLVMGSIFLTALHTPFIAKFENSRFALPLSISMFSTFFFGVLSFMAYRITVQAGWLFGLSVWYVAEFVIVALAFVGLLYALVMFATEPQK